MGNKIKRNEMEKPLLKVEYNICKDTEAIKQYVSSKLKEVYKRG